MLSYYEILLVPTDVDEEQLEQRYSQILDSEDRWPVDPYYPIPLSLFWTAYQTLLNPTKRAAYDQENNIVPQEASYKTCLQWTWEQARETIGQGRTSGPYFAHIGIANLLNGGQIDFINGWGIRRTFDDRLVLITPDNELGDTKPPCNMYLPGCSVDIDQHQTMEVWPTHVIRMILKWRYKWNAYTNEWFEMPVGALRSDQAKARHGPINILDSSGMNRVDQRVFLCCPICLGVVAENEVTCNMCDAILRRCKQCRQLIEYELETCPNCGG
jgi:hypothetical protein